MTDLDELTVLAKAAGAIEYAWPYAGSRSIEYCEGAEQAYIAAMDPTTCLELIKRVRELETDHNDSENALIDSVLKLCDERDQLRTVLDKLVEFTHKIGYRGGIFGEARKALENK